MYFCIIKRFREYIVYDKRCSLKNKQWHCAVTSLVFPMKKYLSKINARRKKWGHSFLVQIHSFFHMWLYLFCFQTNLQLVKRFLLTVSLFIFYRTYQKYWLGSRNLIRIINNQIPTYNKKGICYIYVKRQLWLLSKST